jgi:hypothetical protein
MGRKKNDRPVSVRSRSKSISFLTLPCLRCRARRILGEACTECGARAPAGEVNAKVVERRTAVARVEDGLGVTEYEDDLSHSPPASLPDTETVVTLMQNFTQALSDLISDPMSQTAATRMIHAQNKILSVQRICNDQLPLRPSVALHGVTSRCLGLLAKLWPTYAQALAAPSLHQSQEFGRMGQRIIDQVVAQLNDYEELLKASKAYEDLSVSDFLDRALAALEASHPGLSLIDLGTIGHQAAVELTGVPTDPGSGVHFLLLDTVASIHLDAERFRKVIAATAQFCFEAPNLGAVAGQEGALESLSTISRRLHEALSSFEAMLLRESDSETLLRRTIKLFGEVYEDVGGPLFAWYNLLGNLKQQPYLKLIQQNDVTKLAQNLVVNPDTQSFLEDAHPHLRHAAQHGSSYSLDGDSVSFLLRSYQEQWTRGQVVDAVFKLLESLAAMSWSLTSALEQHGHVIPMSEQDRAYLRLTPFRLATLWLQDRTALTSAEETSNSWIFSLESNVKDVFSFALVLAGGAPETISKVGVRSESAGTEVLVPHSAFDLFTRWPSEGVPPHEHVAALLDLRNQCLQDTKPMLTDTDLRYGVGCLGLLLIAGDQSVMPSLRRVWQIAKDRGYVTEEALARECIRLWRNPDAIRRRKLVAALNEWVDQHSAPEMPTAADVTVFARP